MISHEGRMFYHDKATGYYRTSSTHGDRLYLHRAVYSGTYGNIPRGWHVHHKDENPGNNEIENLVALPMREHVHKSHGITATCEECGEEYTRRRIGSNRWCGPKCGWTWHNRQRYV